MSQRQTNKLTATAVRNAKPRDRTYRLADGGGLYLEVTTAGGKYWRLKYRFHGKEKRLAIGVYGDKNGEVSLAQARDERDKAKKLLAQGSDPSTIKRIAKLEGKVGVANTFRAVATEWLEEVHKHNVVPTHYSKNKRRLERDVYPYLGSRPVADITPLELLECLRKVEKRGHLETAIRIKTVVGMVIRYAITTGRAERDPTTDLRGALRQPTVSHYAAITDPEELTGLLRAIDGYRGQPVTIAALKLATLLFVRPGELRHADWKDFDLDEATWSFLPSKNSPPLIVPLPRQAVTILRELYPLTGRGHFVLPGLRSSKRPMSENTMKGALDSMGYKGKQTAHGFRATARTIIAERLDYPEQYVEQQLAHKVRDANGRAYNRTKFLDQRREMLQTWANYLDELRQGVNNAEQYRHGKGNESRRSAALADG
ncbi:tyrosine-type recombinase/integrase [Billgrantia aerodenitrificans]|uniref:Integrase arm-type DNA-binding domain-containing protein n=1 Tax=Billgrantia aerodenitrificans TaxID=2733483 RepID=A0ABS9AN42_9GAMM|nr:integrase arm-type DNA-binding domain-containing protein [Halomonas aerodenitrificans]MCE8023147.1 integrase arm-type DNA-binding domain-containing protein [Halomonas aerodenitrificans]